MQDRNPGATVTVVTVLLVSLSLSCSSSLEPKAKISNRTMLTDQEINSLLSKRIFFGHQSVGNNILEGVRDLMASDPRLKLNIVKSENPQVVPGPALVEFEVGQNGNPESKIAAFSGVLDKGFGAGGGIGILKFCYVDIDASTDVPAMFASYRDGMKALKSKYPAWKPIHVTVPLTTVEPPAKAWIKSLLGRTTTQDINQKRNQFNTLLLKEFSGIDPIFDLAEVESTHADGSRSYFVRANQKVYTMAREFTDDGGHLNQQGRAAAAERLLSVLAGR